MRNKTKKNSVGTHFIPAAQVREFMQKKGPDYKALCDDALAAVSRTDSVVVPVVKPKKKKGWF